MKINFNKEDLKKFNKLVDTKEINMAVASMFMDYNTYIDVVDEKEMKRSKNEVETYLNTFLDFFSISRRLKENREIIEKSIRPSIKKMDSTIIKNDPYYKSMDEDAYDVVANYANVKKLVEVKDEYKDVEGRMNMCTAIREMMEDSKSEGRMEVIGVMIKTARKYHASDDEIMEQLMTELSISEDEAKEYLKKAE